MSDRGAGMYAPSRRVVGAYNCAVIECRFEFFCGPAAKRRSHEIPDLLVYGAVVSLFRNVFRRAQVEVLPCKDILAQWSKRMMQALDEAHTNCFDGLCMSLHANAEECIAAVVGQLS